MLPSFVLFSFYTEAGANTIKDEASLAVALSSMYYGRAEVGLEHPTQPADPYENFDNRALRHNCSDVTL